MSAFRPLPPRPSLEHERKAAKALLRQLRAGHPDALARARARHPGLDPSTPERARLADAQLVLAREYGFASWPRLVQYFGAVQRQLASVRRSRPHIGGRGVLVANVRGLLARQRAGDATAGRTLAAYVPRLYGLRPEAALAAGVTEDDARLAVARLFGFPSWDVALERAEAQAREPQDRAWEGNSPHRRAVEAIAAADLAALEQVVAAHPELLQPSAEDVAVGRTLIASALGHERRLGAVPMRPILDWLAARGFDRQLELNAHLCGRVGMRTDEIRALLDQGADPNWVAPNGIPVLEHALLRYWNGEAVDLLVAAGTRPRRALWTAAGLGDVNGVRGFLDARGHPTRAARRLRPDFGAAGVRPIPLPPDAVDEELLVEALFVAALNGRAAVLEYMASRGAPVDSLVLGFSLAAFAAGNGLASAVESLARCGASLDLRGPHGDPSARETARELFEQNPRDPDRRRVLAACGLDPDAVLAERDARPAPPPWRTPGFDHALALAADDARRLGQRDARPVNLLVGLLRVGGVALYALTEVGRMDLGRLRAELPGRLRPPSERADGPEPPLQPDADAVVEAAIALATERRQGEVHDVHLLAALTRASDGPTADLLARYGVDAAALGVGLESWLGFDARR